MSELAYLSAHELLQRMNTGQLTSRQLLEYYIARLEQVNPEINAVVALNLPDARQAADQADHDRQSGRLYGPLHGLPMTIKDSFEVTGMPTTSGASRFRNHHAQRDAEGVQRLKQAGAIIFGKTNVPYFTADWQSYNRVYGTTHNPWDRACTPGGSSGGAAAALAAGLTPLEFGSDIGGSIRTPAHYCGVFGHKPTLHAVPLRGHIPGPPGSLSTPDLAVAGPLARSAADLTLALDVVSGVGLPVSKGLAPTLAPCLKTSLTDFKVRAWFNHSLCPLDTQVSHRYSALVESLRQQGVTVDEGQPDELDFIAVYQTYLRLLSAQFSADAALRDRLTAKLLSPVAKYAGEFLKLGPQMDHYLAGLSLSHADWLKLNEKRLQMAEKLHTMFNRYDVLLTPIVPTTAIPHTQKSHILVRHIQVNGQSRPYTDHFPWISIATTLGLPATAAPLGLAANGMPVNVQIIGDAWQDKTTLRFAELLEAVNGGFQIPPAYA
ncbi:MAG: amidase [Hahellaceae bacterium]|nr:amidase [Hahellaceae bacterium]